ncbi:MAG: hypothetical protein IPK69_08655 [Phycisphaerales bacterium]|nr:MAG: hypothetical protein IPK69_08655 [Phycisphaerales bacterium]
MLNRTYVTAASAAMALAMAAYAVNTPEVEPNDDKATATLVTMAAGDTFSGNSISGTTTGIDNFLVRIPADGVLTRYQLDLSTVGAVGHTMTIRGLSQSGGVIGTTDSTVQTATTITADSSRRAVFYGTGASGNRDIYVRVTGTATTTGDYSVVLSSSAVTETAAGGSGTVAAGNITIGEGTGSTADHDWFVYDSSLGVITGYDNDDPDSGRTLSYAAGTYHFAWGNWNTCNNQNSTGGTYLSGLVLDFPNVVANSSTTSISNINMGITSGVGNVQVPMTRTTTTGVSGQFDINWVALTVENLATNPSGSGLATPNSALGDGTGSTLLTVNVVPGASPTSTGLAVTADLSAVGGSATQAFFDDGTNGDVTGGDNIFSYFYNVPVTGGGNFSLPFTVTDAESRSGNGNIALSIVAAPAVFTDLGTLSYSNTPVSSELTYAAGEVKWYKFTIAGANDAVDFLDSWTDTPAVAGPTDTEIGLYDSLGNLVDSDDDDGAGAFSAMSHGLVAPTRPLTGGTAFNGRDGGLAAGTYWMAVGVFNTTFGATGWNATSTATGTGNILLNLVYQEAAAIVANPSITATSDTPDPTLSGTPVLFTATVAQGLPASAISSVTGDFSAVGGTAAEAFNDSGTGGDVTAADGIWSLTFSPTGAPGTTAIVVTATDALSRTATANISHAISGGSSGLPATFTDLGTLSYSATPIMHEQAYAAGDVKWYRFELTTGVADPADYLDLWVEGGTAPGTLTDTEVGLYDNAGNLVVADDDDGAGLYSAESYGAVSPTRPLTGGTAHNGRDGALAAGIYWLAVSEFSTTHNTTNWEVLVPAPADAGDVKLNLVYNTPAPTNPTGVGASTPNAGLGDGSFSPLFTVVTTPGQIPTSTGITVTADLSGIGGSATQAFFDDGTNGDVTGGDGTFSFTYTIPNLTAAAAYSIGFTVADAESRSSTGSFTVTVVGEPTATDLCRVFDPEFKGLLINDLAYAPGQTFWYTFQVPTGGATAAGLTYLDITTVGSVLTGDTFADDTEIAMFDTSGNVVASDDDSGPGFMSQLSYGDTVTPRAADGDGVAAAGQNGDLAAGTYFLAVSSFNITPAGPWVAISDSTATGTIDVTFRTNIAGCVADVDDGSATGVMDGGVTIDDLLYYLAIFNTGNVCADVDDGSATGARDGGVTIDDLLYYLARFNGGC